MTDSFDLIRKLSDKNLKTVAESAKKERSFIDNILNPMTIAVILLAVLSFVVLLYPPDLKSFNTTELRKIYLLIIIILPSIVAILRHHKQTLAIISIHTFLGWTIVGWIVALVMALNTNKNNIKNQEIIKKNHIPIDVYFLDKNDNYTKSTSLVDINEYKDPKLIFTPEMIQKIESRIGQKISFELKKCPRIKTVNEKYSQFSYLSNRETKEMFEAITQIIEVTKSSEKSGKIFKNSKNEACSTEKAFIDYIENLGYKALRTEVAQWSIFTCLAFFEEIFCKNLDGFNRTPIDFIEAIFYQNRKDLIDKKFEFLKSCNLKDFINRQVNDFGNYYTQLLWDWELYYNPIDYCGSKLTQEFLTKINNNFFATITYRIVKSAFENNPGVPDFSIWKDNEFKFVEVKRINEKIRNSQIDWIMFLQKNNIPVEIFRIKDV